MHGFRIPRQRFWVLTALCLFASNAPAFAETTNSADSVVPPPARAPEQADPAATDEQLIRTRISELKEMMVSMDHVRANLTKIAEKALSDADKAAALTERRRYEQLYTETNTRIGELQTTRAEIARLLADLEIRLGTLRNAR